MSKSDTDISQLSNEAAQVWNHPLVQDFMTNQVQKIFVRWLDERDPGTREQLWNEAQGMTAFKRELMNHMTAGSTLQRKRQGTIADGIGAII